MSEAFHIEVDGLTLPRPIGGHAALDLCNTYAGWRDAEGGDYLTSYAHLVTWCGLVGLVADDRVTTLRVTGRGDTRAAGRVLRQTIALRSSLYAAVQGTEHSQCPQCPHDDGDLDVVADAIRRALRVGVLRPESPTPGGPLAWDLSGAGLAEPLHACALAAQALLTGIPSGEVHVCPGSGCGWVFHDPPGRRRWCRMEWCGNRMKQRAHAERKRARRP